MAVPSTRATTLPQQTTGGVQVAIPIEEEEEKDELQKEKEARAAELLDLAVRESLAYEESCEEAATLQRVRLNDLKEARRDALIALNDAVVAEVSAAVAADGGADLRPFLRRLVDRYGDRVARIDDASKLRTPSLCVSCKTFHGRDEWDGLCSACHVLAESSVLSVPAATCAPSFIRAKVTRALFGRFHRRRKLVVPSDNARASGRELLEMRLRPLHRKGFDVKADGACQFRAVSHALWENEDHFTIVRQRVVAYLKQHKPPIHDCEVYVSRDGSRGKGGSVPSLFSCANRSDDDDEQQNDDDDDDKKMPIVARSSPNGSVSVLSVGDDVDAYLTAMARNTSWGDATTLQACADVFRVRIFLVTTFDEQFELIVEPEHEPAVREIWVGFYAEMHYISLVPA
mmetsp:Transcript_17523/g.53416  ORF Transcript_17523/g.53416 Transcript_17523/m.53416 type:complete len:401 (+) Transcript_17523:1-1203(+)